MYLPACRSNWYCSFTLILLIGAFLIAPPSTTAAVLATRTFSFGSWGSGASFGYQPAAAIVLHYGDEAHVNDLATAIFTGKLWTAGDVGSSYSIDASNDVKFGAFVASLTNGTDDRIWRRVVPVRLDGSIDVLASGGGGGPESFFLEEVFPGSNGKDLAGAIVTSIVATLNSGEFIVEALSYRISGSITYKFIGNVPEPNAICLTLLGTLGVLLRRAARI